MPPVGNDIVDLAEPDNIGKSSDKRFCRRVFNPRELSLIANSDRPDSILWALWAAKEAAYKAVSRGAPTVCSIPKKYPVIIADAGELADSPLTGKVVTPLGELPVSIFIDAEMVHAIVAGTVDDLARIIFRVEQVDANNADPPRFARKVLLEEISRRIGCSVGDLSVAKEERRPWAPFIAFRGSRLFADISLSHDGRFVACAFDPAAL
ncbi:MAG: 4'-phosphopantetheinyl transferase superfamily protein [Syntrophobacterales bacterium]|nr:4'-phosphopantetheinyl transferase superfamily protein [Syntrophobacterales bacterium]